MSSTGKNSISDSSRPAFFTIQTLVALVIVALLAWGLGSIMSSPATAQAPPTRIAVIDVQRVVVESNFGKASYAKVKQLQDDRLAKARQMEAELRTLDTEVNKPNVSAAQRDNLVRQISEKRLAMKRFAEDADKEVTEARNREIVALNERVTPVIEALGKEMGLAGVFNKFESGLIYASDAIDITQTVIQRFNSSVPAPTTTTPASQPARTAPASQPARTQPTPRPQPSRRP